MKKEFIKLVSFPRVVIGNLQKLFVVKKQTAKNSGRSPMKARGDDRLIYLHGFTLIELLVVVLIIGILAAIALPQYRKAVFKSRAMESYLLFNKVEEAQKVFYLANGRYASDADELDVAFQQLPNSRRGGVSVNFTPPGTYVHTVIGIGWEFNFNRPGGEYVKSCQAYVNSPNYEYAKQFCQEVGGVYSFRGGSGPQDYYIVPNR